MDVITYLTYVEENLTKEKLPILHDVLQESADLTEAIGWDLVKILIPLVPESESCLFVVARLGNPKEVILRVAESLRAIEFDTDEEDDDEQDEPSATPTNGVVQPLPLPLQQFQYLVYMLLILHPRINAKYPSRFLSSSLQAMLAAYSNAHSHLDDLANDLVRFVKVMAGPKRPHFPPRRPSSALAIATELSRQPTPDPILTNTAPTEEDKIQTRLLQSFLTHVLDDFMQRLTPVEGVAGLAWTTRYMEHTKHPMLLSQKISLTEQFSHSTELESRLSVVGQIVALAQDLEIHNEELLSTIMDSKPEEEGNRAEEDSYPKAASEIPLSKAGSLYLLTARKAMEVLYDGPEIRTLPIFPDHANLMQNFASSGGPEMLSMGPEALVDALLFHGLVALQSNEFGKLESDVEFNQYLQLTSVLSACLSSPTLRFQAHYLTSTVLRSHPRELIQIEFIKDTLEHCPFENLKTSAVSWIKGLTLEAAQLSTTSPIPGTARAPSLFATPAPLATLAPVLFPDIREVYPDSPVVPGDESFEDFRLNYSFYAAAVNFLYLLLLDKKLQESLQVSKVLQDSEILRTFLNPLISAIQRYVEALKEGGSLHEVAVEEVGLKTQLEMLWMSCDDVGTRLAKEWLDDGAE
jgi:uncharacterized protein YAP/Alf4/glomulin family